MNNLQQYILEKLHIDRNTKINRDNEEFFWKWIEDVPFSMVNKVNQYGPEKLYDCNIKLKISVEDFRIIEYIYAKKVDAMYQILLDDDKADMSDDGCWYAACLSPFYGEKLYTHAIQTKNWKIVCDRNKGEDMGYAMNPDDYNRYLISKHIKI